MWLFRWTHVAASSKGRLFGRVCSLGIHSFWSSGPVGKLEQGQTATPWFLSWVYQQVGFVEWVQGLVGAACFSLNEHGVHLHLHLLCCLDRINRIIMDLHY